MQANSGWNSPVLSSYPRTQPGFLKSAIFGKYNTIFEGNTLQLLSNRVRFQQKFDIYP
jgi:hypothetical protein